MAAGGTEVSERKGKRRRVMMTATLLTPGGAHKVGIRDISPDGAHVVGVAIPSTCDALLKRDTLFAAARVMWSDDSEAGLRFYRKLAPDDLLPNLIGPHSGQFDRRGS